jgi:hypothetical protein
MCGFREADDPHSAIFEGVKSTEDAASWRNRSRIASSPAPSVFFSL